MAQSREVVLNGLTEELAGFVDLTRSLTDDQWQMPSRCAGWTVADVCAHVAGSFADIAAGRLAELASADAPDRHAAERQGRTQLELADELEQGAKVAAEIGAGFDDEAWVGSPPVDIPGTLGEAVEGMWYDAYVHGDDVRTAIGAPSDRGPGLQAAVSHLSDLLSHNNWEPATLAFDGMPAFVIGDGQGRRITGDALPFVLVATGREDPAVIGLDSSVNVYG